jgi:hypothetical protein
MEEMYLVSKLKKQKASKYGGLYEVKNEKKLWENQQSRRTQQLIMYSSVR